MAKAHYHLWVTICGLLMISLMNADAYAELPKQSFEIMQGGSTLHINFQTGFNNNQQQRMLQWQQQVSSAMLHAYGRLPLPDIHIELEPYTSNKKQSYLSGKEVVPFAKVIRWPQQGIKFLVKPSADLKSLVNDWTAYHEFSHLMIPYPGDDDMWFSEGLASYYQNLILSRAGIIEPLAAWQRINRGFKRGQRDNRAPTMSLQELSPVMWQNRSFMRVYWSGVRYFLTVDIALRQQGKSLDEALSELQLCCILQRRSWRAIDIIKKLDQLSQSSAFSDNYQMSVDSKSLGEVSSLWQQLGLRDVQGQLQPAATNGVSNLLWQQVMSHGYTPQNLEH
jgi:hypothetical protein